MDRNAFDSLVRGFGSRRSRRAAVRGLAAGLLGLGAAKGAAAQVGIQARTCGQFCEGDAQCNAGLQCGTTSERCFAIPDSRTRCNGNGDCPRNFETCNNNGRCVNTVVPDTCDECRRDGDCEVAGTRCVDGRCLVPECTVDDECRRRERCNGKGRCVDRN